MASLDQPKAFAHLVSEFESAGFWQGERGESRLLVTFHGGDIVKNANRILNIEPKDVAKFVAQAQEYFNELRKPHEGRTDAVETRCGSTDATSALTRAEYAQQCVFSQEAQSGEERPMRELLEELLLGREADREIMSQLVQQQNQIVQFFDCLGTR
ncbi:hypothetical protein [Pseudophaeobacter sp.]|uniref:hypothetical protein n=1 Tax=Pseudophaeobacter sp. TaxID=1971739 RepID=UPI0032982C90